MYTAVLSENAVSPNFREIEIMSALVLIGIKFCKNKVNLNNF